MNGLQSLMAPRPQQDQPTQAPAMPAQNDPRMAAAMDVVKNDVPEPLRNLVDENDFARKAMELLQSAGGQAAMNQPPATPPTVKQRVDQQAMEGVAGLLQRLAPGMQQRGQQVQQAQARKMIGGGMPTMGAPNMARMAMGGIVGYQAGGGVEEQPMMGPPEPNLYQRMGQGLKNYGTNAQESMDILRAAKAGVGVPYENRSAAIQQVRDQIAAEKQNRDPNFIQRMGQKLMDAGLNVEESKSILKKFYDTFGKTYEEMSNGMAMGGQIKGYAGPDGSEVEADLPQEVLDEIERLRRISELNAQMETAPRQRSALSRGVNELTPEQAARNQVLRTQAAAVRSPNTEVVREGIFSPISDASVGTAEGGRGAPQTDVAETLKAITGLQVPTADISSLPRADRLRTPVEDAMLKRIQADPEQARIAEEDRQRALAQAAYQMSPEMQAEYDRRKATLDEYYTAQLDPKRQRSQKLNALLKGLATPGGIARSGIAALEGTTAVDDARIAARRKQAEEQFGIAKEMGDVERESRAKAFEAARTSGQSAFERASSGLNQAAQSLTQLATSDETRAQAAAVQDYTRQMDALKSQLNVFLQQEKLAAEDQKTAAKLVSDIRKAQSAKDDKILEIQNSMIVYTPEQKTAAQELIRQAQAEKALLQEEINSLAFKLGLPVNIPAASGAGGGSTDLPAGFVPD